MPVCQGQRESIWRIIKDSMPHRIAISLAKPNSVGNIKLKSRDYNDPPLIDPNYLDDPTDVPRLLKVMSLFMACTLLYSTF